MAGLVLNTSERAREREKKREREKERERERERERDLRCAGVVWLAQRPVQRLLASLQLGSNVLCIAVAAATDDDRCGRRSESCERGGGEGTMIGTQTSDECANELAHPRVQERKSGETATGACGYNRPYGHQICR